jgi:hypothetical protein
MLRALLLAAFAALFLPTLAQARPAAITWCGTDEVTANRVPDLDVSSTSQIRVYYVVPADGVDHFAAYASGIATDIEWIAQWWQGQDPTRAPRFDRYPFPGCNSTYGALDLGFARLPQAESDYAGPGGFSRIVNDLNAALVPDGRQKSLVYYDGQGESGDVCGTSERNALYGGLYGISVVYLQSDCGLSPPGTGGSADTAAHELIHNFGAEPVGAPHACPDSPGHVCDSNADILAQYYTPGTTLDSQVLDVNHDDYYAHSGSWWDVQDSSWLAHLPQSAFAVVVRGSGTLAAITNDGTTLPCERGCSNLELDYGLALTVVPHPAKGWTFSGWSGCPAPGAACGLTVTAPTTLAATFVRTPVPIRVAVAGKGRVTSAPAGIACPGSCSHLFAAGTKVRLKAKPARGWRFAAWTGACRGTRACTVVADRQRAVRARFAKR